MNTNNQYGLPTVSVEVFANLISQVPKGKLTTVPDLLQVLKKAYNGQIVFLDFPSYSQHPLWNEIPWWRIIGSEGELLDGITGLMEEQDKYLLKQGKIARNEPDVFENKDEVDGNSE